MKDCFVLPLESEGRDAYGADGFFAASCNNGEEALAAAHAINCHDELVEALEAFAAMADAFNDAIYPTPNKDHDILYSRETMQGAFCLTVGDLRRARAILNKAKGTDQ